MHQVFAYIDAIDLERCARTSKRWHELAVHSNRWKSLYLDEGWLLDNAMLDQTLTRASSHAISRTARKHGSPGSAGWSRKRHRSNEHLSYTSRQGDTSDWNEQHGVIEADTPYEQINDRLHGEQNSTADDPQGSQSRASSRVLKATQGANKIDWLYLYKHRRRLEQNWNEGQYTSFRLPSAEHPEDGHTECVYTIQYSGNYLVSGSRDQTIKIWDLEIQRCVRTLWGAHRSSVLCLQFDAEQDLIVSGGSDSLVVLWKFSTGEIIRNMTEAHTESVLNLRFDDRYLVTCSKDKMIKLWNRKQIARADPLVPAAWTDELAAKWTRHVSDETLEEYSLIGVLEGHSAAVNAIQLHKGLIVSASGDRTIKLWDINTLTCIREFNHHLKGIACVQFDGRRIISGSSDKSVMIFDVATTAPVARLNGHQDLVRTVQARFGDMSVTDKELSEAAWEADLEHMKQTGDHDSTNRAMGARIPYGGGGSKWSRIVSGSYDESVVIWKKTKSGDWIVSRRLYQDEILQDAPNRRTALDQRANQVQPPTPVGLTPITAAAPLSPVSGAPEQAQVQQAFTFHDPPAPPPVTTFHPPPPMITTIPRALGRRADHRADDNKRLLKLQFDCRRIICCSQNRMIVGWDFANKDPDLEVASRYYTESE